MNCVLSDVAIADCQGIAIVGVSETGGLAGAAQQLDQLMSGRIAALREQKVIKTKLGAITWVSDVPGALDLVMVVGLGKAEKLHRRGFLKAANAAISALENIQAAVVTTYLADHGVDSLPRDWCVRALAQAVETGAYRFKQFKSKADPIFQIDAIQIWSADPQADEAGFQLGQKTGQGMSVMRDLAHTPPNICTPQFLVNEALSISHGSDRVGVTVFDEAGLKEKGMHALLAVGQGSRNESYLIHLSYHGAPNDVPPIILVGKGVTFDTGGVNLKSSPASMKYDMGGAATVMGTFQAVVSLGLPLNVMAIVPTVENMPDGIAYRPDDVLTTYAGKTVEVTNTDAEGRLILCDALTYAQEFRPRYIVDCATLTGAMVVALGSHYAGLFTQDDELSAQLTAAGEAMADPVWRMPLDEVYQSALDSTFADMLNCARTRGAGSVTAACFLSRFIDDGVKWAHLDIAGVAIPDSGKALLTGRPVSMLVEWLHGLS